MYSLTFFRKNAILRFMKDKMDNFLNILVIVSLLILIGWGAYRLAGNNSLTQEQSLITPSPTKPIPTPTISNSQNSQQNPTDHSNYAEYSDYVR